MFRLRAAVVVFRFWNVWVRLCDVWVRLFRSVLVLGSVRICVGWEVTVHVVVVVPFGYCSCCGCDVCFLVFLAFDLKKSGGRKRKCFCMTLVWIYFWKKKEFMCSWGCSFLLVFWFCMVREKCRFRVWGNCGCWFAAATVLLGSVYPIFNDWTAL